LLFLALLISLVANLPSYPQQRTQTTPAKPKPQKLSSHVILVSIDGLSADYIVKPDAYKLRIPNLRALRSKGAYAVGAESVYPSLTYPAHTTIATGMLPADHGITSNRVFDEQSGEQRRDWHWFAREIKTDTIWDAAKRAGLVTAAVGYPVTVGSAINFNLPEIFNVPGSESSEPPIRRHANPPELLDELSAALKVDASKLASFTLDLPSFEMADRIRTDAAVYLIEKHRPNLLLLHLVSFDQAQHKHGPFSAEALAVLERVDELLKRMMDAAERAGIANETAIFIVSDHGFMKVEREFHPNVVLAKKGLLTVGAQGKITSWRASAQTFGGSAAIIVKDPKDEQAVREAEEAFTEIFKQPDSPIWRIVSRRDISRLGADPRAAFYIEAAPMTIFSSGNSGATISKSSERGAHGYLPQRSEMRASLMMAGRGIKPGVKLEYARLTDVAPTIVRLLGLEMRAVRGRVMTEVIAQ
jgi:predicted AlkP superfamily pyrophosphatase or phosphodiesterase